MFNFLKRKIGYNSPTIVSKEILPPKKFTCIVEKEENKLIFTFNEVEIVNIKDMFPECYNIVKSIPDGRVSREYVSQILPLLFPHKYV